MINHAKATRLISKIVFPTVEMTVPFDVVTSAAYINTSDNLSFLAVKAKFSDKITGSESFDASGEVVGTSIADNASGGWCADLNVVRANVEKYSFSKVSYAWQVGKNGSYTRTFNIKTVYNSSDNQTGNAFFGFNPHPDNSSGSNKFRSPKIDRMICNWAGSGQSHTGVSKVQLQQLSYDSTNNVWKSASNIITFSPTNGL